MNAGPHTDPHEMLRKTEILHEILRVVSRCPHYCSCYIAENRLPLRQCTVDKSVIRTSILYVYCILYIVRLEIRDFFIIFFIQKRSSNQCTVILNYQAEWLLQCKKRSIIKRNDYCSVRKGQVSSVIFTWHRKMITM